MAPINLYGKITTQNILYNNSNYFCLQDFIFPQATRMEHTSDNNWENSDFFKKNSSHKTKINLFTTV